MKKQFILILLLALYNTGVLCQVAWSDTSRPFSEIEWNNYSTSYMGSDKDSVPFLVTAIPYNGIYEMPGNAGTPLDMSFNGSAFRFQSNLSENYRQLYTYDSSNVYFLTPGIFRQNAGQYEFRILQDGQTVIKPWSNITIFTDAGFQLNSFKKQFGFLGGYAATWDHYLVAELRKKGQEKTLSTAIVYWKQARPALLNIVTGNELVDFLLQQKKLNDPTPTRTSADKWLKKYSPNHIDSTTGLPQKLLLDPGENNVLFFLDAVIYKKEALEYRLVKNGHVYSNWQPNNVDNNFIWLKNLEPGNYVLQMRYAKQRQNVTEYPFEQLPAWYQTWVFKLIVSLLFIAFFGSFILLFKLRAQRRKTAEEKAKKEKQALELKSVHAQLNPHFIFNALSSIQGLINKNDINGANRYLSDFGALVRSSLTNSNKEFIPLAREIDTLEIYLKLEQLRFNFSYTLHYAGNIRVAEVEVPSLLLQPLVENAVKHGVSMMAEKGMVTVDFKREALDLIACIKDNGQGFTPGNMHDGFGLKLTRDRIQLLNELFTEQQIVLHINSSKAGGTVIEILFKNWLA